MTTPTPGDRVAALASLYSEMGSDGPSITLRHMRERQAREDIELFEKARLLVADRVSIRQVMEDVLVRHQRMGSRACGCGDRPLGSSFPGHQVDMILAALDEKS